MSSAAGVLPLVFTGFALGLLFNATPGAVFAETLRRGLRGGFWPAFDVQLGSLVGDALWAVAGLSAAAALLAVSAVRVPLALAGSAYLLMLGLRGLHETFAAGSAAGGGGLDPAVQRAGAVRAGVLLSVTNPQNIGFWAAVGAVVPALGRPEPAMVDLAWFFGGFIASSILWCGICAGLVAWLRHALPEIVVRGIHLTCGLFLIALAALQWLRLGQESGGLGLPPAAAGETRSVVQ